MIFLSLYLSEYKFKTVNMKKVLFLILTIVMLSCTDKDGARETLLNAGLKPISVGGYGWFSGGRGDAFITKFKAYAPNDSTRIVNGVVCKGLFLKSSTIRFD